MNRNKIIPYNSKLKSLARQLRLNSTKSEKILWNQIKRRVLGYEFHRQVPIDEYIVDFYSHELHMAVEIDGYTHDYNFENDDIRQKRLKSFGLRIIRFTDDDVKKHRDDVIRALKIVITEIERLNGTD